MPKNNAPTGKTLKTAMNDMRTLTTPTALARAMCRAGCVLLLALGACSCTTDADPLSGPTPDTAPRLIEINIGPKPQFSPTNPDGTPADHEDPARPGTRATQTEAAAEWEEGDIVWVKADFFYTKDNSTLNTPAFTALIYDQGAWRSLTEKEAADHVQSERIRNLYQRTLRWLPDALGKTGSYCDIKAVYVGNKTPDNSGEVTLIDADCPLSKVNLIETDPISFYLGKEPPTLQFKQSQVRIRLTKDCEAKIISFSRETEYSVDLMDAYPVTYSSPAPERLPAGDYFCGLALASRLEINNVQITFLPRAGDTYDGLSYTIDPDALTNGPVTPY